MRATLAPEVIASVRIATRHSLFASTGYPDGITRATRSIDVIANAITRADPPTPLARALFTLAAFATDAARADIYLAFTKREWTLTKSSRGRRGGGRRSQSQSTRRAAYPCRHAPLPSGPLRCRFGHRPRRGGRAAPPLRGVEPGAPRSSSSCGTSRASAAR